MFSSQKNSFNTASNPYNPFFCLIFDVTCKNQTNIVDFLFTSSSLKGNFIEK